MENAENETHSYNLLVLQPLLPTHFVNEIACSSQKQQQYHDLETCLNNSFHLFADTLMPKFENLTSKIVEKSTSRVKATWKRLRKDRLSDDEEASPEPPSESESEFEEQVRQRREKQYVKINCSRTKTDKRKECQKGSVGEAEDEYDDWVSLHADDDSELAGNLNNYFRNQQGIRG